MCLGGRAGHRSSISVCRSRGKTPRFPHITGGADIDRLRETVTIGATVVLVFKPAEERTGNWDDIEHFIPVEVR